MLIYEELVCINNTKKYDQIFWWFARLPTIYDVPCSTLNKCNFVAIFFSSKYNQIKTLKCSYQDFEINVSQGVTFNEDGKRENIK